MHNRGLRVCIVVARCMCVGKTGSKRQKGVSQIQPGTHKMSNCQSRGHEIKSPNLAKKGGKAEAEKQGRQGRKRRMGDLIRKYRVKMQ